MRGVESLADVEPPSLDVIVSRAVAQQATQVGQEPQVEIRDPLLQDIERPDRSPDKIEQRIVRLTLPHQTIQNFGHKERHRRFADIERQALQRETRPDLAKTVHLPVRRLQPFELDGKHRLEERQFRPPASRTDSLHHVAATAADIGQQIGHQR